MWRNLMKNKVFLCILLSLFIFFIILLLAQSQGYYKNRNEKAKILTEEQIINFEEDIKNGKKIDIKKYVLYEDKDYSNKISKDVYGVSLKLENIVDSAIKMVFNGVGSLVSE